MKNQIMLITYGDSLGKNFNEMESVLEKHYQGAVGSIHILPFFPSSADRGFAPMQYDKADEKFGSFEDLKRIGEKYELMYDFMVNHISAHSPYYLDFKEKKDASAYKDMFIRYSEFWENGEPTEEQVDKIYKRKPKAPYVDLTFADGTTEKIWCTFSEEQIDLDVTSPSVKKFIEDTIEFMCSHGASIIRLDAFAYAVKKADTSCFFVEPEMWDLLYDIEKTAEKYGAEILPEIHEHYSIQMKIAEKEFWVYDFALPMLVLHALYTHRGDRLKHWLDICPRKQMTTLDTHDGIGVVDVVDLLSPEEIEETKELLYSKGANVKKKYSSEEYNNLDIYQINCSFYSALGNDDDAYLLARAIQFFAPGIPQVYYVGMLAGENDLELLEQTKEGRNINRHYYTLQEIDENFQRPVVRKLRDLMKFRNECPAFDGDCLCESNGSQLRIIRDNGTVRAVLEADLETYKFQIRVG
ncbi:sucrose phosphorylase [Faecalicatena contorta]|uniref:Sucrose 6(F)-phosphate phosphorylase n=1 Tax=Faecalicatena contorta TaxID=39482 RepID=A0A316A232_9FIRM|nr:sucrose phosphorylase [Faecalicatena contorta]PWJ51653.1 sucrose phosphorylase [Faecalicatena contorta]SUQ13209.1 sucrose phosphorylase [Faecalicatena contorta]